MRKGMETSTILRIVVGFVLLAVIISTLMIISGKGEELIPRDVGGLFSPCKQEDVTFEGFMKAVNKIYSECSDKDICEWSGCKKLALKLPEDVKCYKVDKKTIESYGLTPFSCLVGGFKLKCNEGPQNNDAEEIAYFGPDKDSDKFCKVSGMIQSACMGDYFLIGDGAKITASAKKQGTLWKETDLKLRVEGGDYSDCENAPVKKENSCESNSNCVSNSHGYCDGGVCTYSGYCSHFCEDIGKGTCPAEVGDKCKKIELSCTMGGACTAKSGYSLTNSCPNGVSTTITGFDKIGVMKYITHSPTPPLASKLVNNVYETGGRYYMKDAGFLKEAGVDSDKAVMSLEIYKVTNDKDVILYQGCYGDAAPSQNAPSEPVTPTEQLTLTIAPNEIELFKPTDLKAVVTDSSGTKRKDVVVGLAGACLSASSMVPVAEEGGARMYTATTGASGEVSFNIISSSVSPILISGFVEGPNNAMTAKTNDITISAKNPLCYASEIDCGDAPESVGACFDNTDNCNTFDLNLAHKDTCNGNQLTEWFVSGRVGESKSCASKTYACTTYCTNKGKTAGTCKTNDKGLGYCSCS